MLINVTSGTCSKALQLSRVQKLHWPSFPHISRLWIVLTNGVLLVSSLHNLFLCNFANLIVLECRDNDIYNLNIGKRSAVNYFLSKF